MYGEEVKPIRCSIIKCRRTISSIHLRDMRDTELKSRNSAKKEVYTLIIEGERVSPDINLLKIVERDLRKKIDLNYSSSEG